ncbi:MAG TPA: hypothetical protein VLV15_08285 [Dongiaceae bacterium]|nr:hypothetical protein [Dongiaceae bacterium]
MSGEIKRTGPPTARDVKGRLITWTVPLNAMPDMEWRQLFLQTKDTTVVCTPDRIHMYQGMIVFESLEEDVPTWITFVDRWTAAANTRHAEQQASRRPAIDSGTPRDRERKLGELNEKFKNL